MFARLWREEEGVLTFEWVSLNTLLVVGVVTALTQVRDAVNYQLTGIADTIYSLDQINADVYLPGTYAPAGNIDGLAVPPFRPWARPWVAPRDAVRRVHDRAASDVQPWPGPDGSFETINGMGNQVPDPPAPGIVSNP